VPSLLARFAENNFWLARYMERAENLARILDVNETFAQDGRGPEDWLPIVHLHDDTARFFASHEVASAEAVIRFYVLERDNPTSIVASVRMARENARALRHLISTEMWRHLNVFYNRLAALGPDDLNPSQLSRLCATIKEDCQLHTGIVEGTYYRDQGWYFYQIGKYLERTDQTTRLLDINYHRLMPSPDEADSGMPCCARRPAITPSDGRIRAAWSRPRSPPFCCSIPAFRDPSPCACARSTKCSAAWLHSPTCAAPR
jgi:uncharacterized alpha-E superfamily protein